MTIYEERNYHAGQPGHYYYDYFILLKNKPLKKI